MLNVDEKNTFFPVPKMGYRLTMEKGKLYCRRISTNCKHTVQDHKTLSSLDELHVFEER